jgi:hypothetical protein
MEKRRLISGTPVAITVSKHLANNTLDVQYVSSSITKILVLIEEEITDIFSHIFSTIRM